MIIFSSFKLPPFNFSIAPAKRIENKQKYKKEMRKINRRFIKYSHKYKFTHLQFFFSLFLDKISSSSSEYIIFSFSHSARIFLSSELEINMIIKRRRRKSIIKWIFFLFHNSFIKNAHKRDSTTIFFLAEFIFSGVTPIFLSIYVRLLGASQ